MANTRVTNPVTDFDKTNTTQGLKLPSGTNSNQPTGVDAIQGMLRNDTEETVNSSASALAHYNGTEWRYFAASVSAGPYSFEYLAVAGGGGGGGGASDANGGGGGGAGGYYTATSSVLNIGIVVDITIGNGGTAGPNSYTTQLAGSGGDTIVTQVKGGTLTCSGGGGGASGDGALAGGNGGSGGGGKQSGSSGGTGLGFTGEQVADGGDGASGTGGGGGGAGQNGFDAVAASGGGADGGDGLSSSITGTATYYAGGGAGAGYYFGNAPGGQTGSGSGLTPKGGLGGGGNASINASTGLTSPQDGTDGLGGGGGARNCWNNAGTGGRGGSGVVIFKIASSDYSGTVTGSPAVDTTSVPGYTIIKFTGSGSYTV